MRLRFSQLLCVVLLGGVLVFLSDGYSEAEGGWASYYGAELTGSPTASGEPFDPYGYTAAHKTLPLGTQLMVNYAGRSVQVTVNDRGPYSAGRELDLSQGAAEYLGLTQAGVDYVDYAVVGSGYEGYAAEEPAYAGPGGAYVGTDDVSYSTNKAYDPADADATGDGSYVVQSGDTLTGIAAELGTTTESLAEANDIVDPNLLYAGQKLTF
ncbi:MAG TPA: septal ring lytic transglycosylase RlpA family protein [Rubrobacteraceae bacterium]|nr:septal ring lytic transglycosylase RlpA family protein [Rubrobacteraceae bacterium]